MNVQILKKCGVPEYAVLPIADFNKLAEDTEMLHDITAYDAIKKEIANGNEEFFPADLIHREPRKTVTSDKKARRTERNDRGIYGIY